MAELQQLQEFEIPTGREALRGNHSSLLRVADYCEDNYVQATDKRKALEETMAFTTQALASVAYQVGNLAGHTLRMLDLQAASLRQVEARVSTLGQMVNMHMEKVARREIGTLATVRRLPPGQKVIPPESLPSLTPYYRRPLNFGCLDDIGHGIKVERGALPLPPRHTLFCLMSPFSPVARFSSTAMFLSQAAAPFFPHPLKPSPQAPLLPKTPPPL
ncbi:hypothetical protein HPG69_003008 [Diceros bicornis minor]|uniref:Abl-interactor homeo-domain homologous domain-containing protein n=1 Tax=Diceros bicornis minor TaxID=77932 RepID=A0A7J7EJJ0_DICBM|nr:hypothetical protein HPG69_003008 [Diceros bicornis minor]